MSYTQITKSYDNKIKSKKQLSYDMLSPTMKEKFAYKDITLSMIQKSLKGIPVQIRFKGFEKCQTCDGIPRYKYMSMCDKCVADPQIKKRYTWQCRYPQAYTTYDYTCDAILYISMGMTMCRIVTFIASFVQ